MVGGLGCIPTHQPASHPTGVGLSELIAHEFDNGENPEGDNYIRQDSGGLAYRRVFETPRVKGFIIFVAHMFPLIWSSRSSRRNASKTPYPRSINTMTRHQIKR